MKYTLFRPLDILAYVKRIDISFHPGAPKSEVCRQLVLHMNSAWSKQQFPNLQHSYKIVGYPSASTIDIEMTTGKKFSFIGERNSYNEIHIQIDEEQYKAHLQYMKNNNIEKRISDD